MEMAQRLDQGTECNKWLSISLSLNNHTTYDMEICHKTTERERERKRERERERAKEKKKERTNERKKEKKKEKRERASSMPNDTAAAGNRAPQAEFLSLVLPVL